MPTALRDRRPPTSPVAGRHRSKTSKRQPSSCSCARSHSAKPATPPTCGGSGATSPTVLAATALLVGLPPPEHGRNRAGDESQVAPQRPAADVDVVEVQHLAEGDAATARDLPESGDPGLEREAMPAPVLDPLVLVERQWSWADKAHVPLDHVEELGKLVDRELPKLLSERRD